MSMNVPEFSSVRTKSSGTFYLMRFWRSSALTKGKLKRKNLRLTDRGFEQLLYLLGKTVSNISFECAFCQSKKNAVPKQK